MRRRDRHLWRPGLLVPARERREVGAVGVRHRGAEVVAGHRLPVVPLEIKVHPFPEALLPQDALVHADDLGALLVDRQGVEVVHLDVGLGADRVGHGAGVLFFIFFF